MKILNSSPTICDVRDLRDGISVDQVLLVREREIRRTRAGANYMRLALADRTGTVPAVVWDDVDEAAATATAGEPVRVIGTFSEHPRYGAQLTVQGVLAPLDIDWKCLLDTPATPAAELERRLERPHRPAPRSPPRGSDGAAARHRLEQRRRLPARLRRPLQPPRLPLRAARALPTGRRHDRSRRQHVRRRRPRPRHLRRAAARHRQARRLLRRRARRRAERRWQADRRDPSGYYTVRRAIEDIPGFPAELVQALLHIILSHHGCIEHGSPVLPSTREALVVHAMDKLSGDLGSFDRLQRETAEDETWSRFDRALGRSVLLGDRYTAPC